jgi:hypothetical protein
MQKSVAIGLEENWMKFKLNEKTVDTTWTETFVWFKVTQDRYLVLFDRVWTKHDLTTGRTIYRVSK